MTAPVFSAFQLRMINPHQSPIRIKTSAEQILNHPKYLKTQNYINGEFIEEPKIDKELNLKEATASGDFAEAKRILDEMEHGQVLRLVVNTELAVDEVPKVMEFEGHKILEVKRLDQTDWEILIQKRSGNYTI